MSRLSLSEKCTLMWRLGKYFLLALFACFVDLLCYPFGSLVRPSARCAWKVKDISPSWLTTKLRSSDHIGKKDEIDNIEVKGLVIGGYMGHVNRLKLHYKAEPKDGAPRTLIVKQSVPGLKGRFLCLLARFVGELRFYEQLRDLVPIPTPIFYHGQEFLGSDFMILMSDIDGSPGPDSTKFSEKNIPLPLIRKAIRNLAKFHAKFWNSDLIPTIPHLNRAPPRTDPFPHILMKASIDNVFKAFPDCMPKSWTPESLLETLKVREALLPHFADLPRVVAHSDYRLGNMLVSDKTGKYLCTTVDWQGFHVAHPFTDLCYIICTDLPVEVRRKELRNLIQEYVNKVKKCGVRDEILDDPERLYTTFCLGVLDYPMMVWLLGSGFADVSQGEAKRQMSMWYSRCVAALEDLGSVELAKSIINKEA